jgi:ectoine hydroxylase-related dioxygenase (phytanoyl-CoA dioxygenase family)
MRQIFQTTDLQEVFDERGYVVVNFLSTSDVERLVQIHDDSTAKLAAGPYLFTAMSPDPIHRRTVSDGIRSVLAPKLSGIMKDCRPVLGNFFCKLPNSDSEFHIHQDWSFVDETEHASLTIWCPLQRVNEENGTLAVVPGSHRLTSHPRGFVTRFPYVELEAVLKAKYSCHLSPKVGQAVFFHQRIFHWSRPNETTERRLAFNCFVAPEEATLLFPHVDPKRHPDRIEIFAGDDELLTSFILGERPANARSLGWLDSNPEPLTESVLERELSRFWTCGS